MRLTKRQLKRIIREERLRVLREIGFYDETQDGTVLPSDSDLQFELQVQLEKAVKHVVVQAVKDGLDPSLAYDSVLRAADEYEGR